ncbi:MAG: hypothetical protein FI723_03710 [SAR202 cluster bacterium]|nr:hypothetical protein [SAR202 cluster bacterium]
MSAAALILLVTACSDATATPSPSATPNDVIQGNTPTPTIPATVPAAQSTPLILPTPHPDTAPWVTERIDAIVALYQPTKAGEALLRSLDLRQMEGEPGFFGSYGFTEWAGVGEASPIGVAHELGHSYWGGFKVAGRPDLSWAIPSGSTLSPALESYHQDVLTFITQPPDDFELLRQRLRNLPDVSSDNPEPIIHNMEADVVYNTAGSLNLVPPILRKYWADFLPAGRFDDWYGAAGWFQSLSQDDVSLAGKWLGFEHLDLRQYPSLDPATPPEDILLAAQRVIETEEKERLRDLAYQFDLLIGYPQNDEDFEFWRRYLRDKVTLYRDHPAHLAVFSISRAEQIDSALRFLAAPATGSPAQQAQRLADRLVVEPFLVNFLPAVDNQVLVELFSSGTALPEGKTLQATASFVERLKIFGAKVDSVLRAGRSDPTAGAAELESFITDTGLDQKEDIKLFFDLFKDIDRKAAKDVTFALSNETIQGLMVPAPFQLRTILGPEELLSKLGIESDAANQSSVRDGIALLVEEPSGNFQVDEPFLAAMFQVVAERAEDDPLETALLLVDSPFPLEGMILAQPAAASSIFKSDREFGLALVRNSDSLIAPPWRIMYRLVKTDPSLAAGMLGEFQRRGEAVLVAESLAYLAYDKDRQERSPLLPISLEDDGRFLGALFKEEGAEWLAARLSESVELYRQRVSANEVGAEFLERYRETLEFAAAFLDDGETRKGLTEIIRRAFGMS